MRALLRLILTRTSFVYLIILLRQNFWIIYLDVSVFIYRNRRESFSIDTV